MKLRQALNLIWNEFVYGGHLIALAAPAFIFTTIILLNKKTNWEPLIIGYLLAFINYRYNYNKGIENDSLTNPERSEYLKKHTDYSKGLIASYFLFLFTILIFFTNLGTILFTIFLAIVGICYTILFKKFTKRIAVFKNIYAATPWALLAVFVGFYYSTFEWSIFFIFVFIFLRFFLNTIFFDIKDIESDRKDGIKTMPTIFSKEKTLKILHVLNFLSFIPIMIGVYMGFLPRIASFLLIFYFYGFYYLEKSKDENINIRKFSHIVVDGEFLFWPVILLIGKIIL